MPIYLKDVCFTYQPDSPFQSQALKGISCTIYDGEIIGVTGPTGAGKSTFLQLLNGILKPTVGQVEVDGVVTSQLKGRALVNLRQKVGLVFQFPEDQLFEANVFDDIAFGPRNLGWSEGEVKRAVQWAMNMLELNKDEFQDRSIQELSSGQKRRVALAGSLAMRPNYLLLDEPTAGLDARGRQLLLALLQKLNCEYHTTVVIVSHRLEDIAAVCQRLLVFQAGQLALQGTVSDVFGHREALQKAGLQLPPLNELLWKLKAYRPEIDPTVLTLIEAADEIERAFKGMK